jgi:TolA-binding protein
LADYARAKKAAALALEQPDRLKKDPEEKARLEALVKEPAPEYVAKAAFFSSELLYEKGRFEDALSRFENFPKQYPLSTLLGQAQLRRGFCQVRLKQFAEAVKTLQPVADKEPQLADQALLWIGKAQAGGADPKNVQAHEQALRTALATFSRAATLAQQLAANDPEAKVRRGEIFFEQADTQQRLRQFREAAGTYAAILNEKLLPGRDEEVLQCQAGAYHLAGDYNASEQVCARFRQAYLKSPRLAAIMYRSAQNASAGFEAAEKNPNLPDRANTLAKLAGEAAKRYQEVMEKYPRFAYINHARHARGLLFYRLGDFKKARQELLAIPQKERKRDLAATSYLLADCLLQLAPAKTNGAGRLRKQLQSAVELLDAFISAQPRATQTPDALLKLALCHQRLAALQSRSKDRLQVLADARSTYERMLREFPKDALVPQAVYERARCLAQSGQKKAAVTELQRFRTDPLKTNSVAPLALLQLAQLLRAQDKAGEAAQVLGECRSQHEQALLRDPQRSGWVITLYHHQGKALWEAGQHAQAAQVFDGLIRLFPNRTESAEAAQRRGQCLKDEALGKIKAGRKMLAVADLKPQDQANANRLLEEGYRTLQPAVQYLADQANQLKQTHPTWEVRARMLYESAWGYRELAVPEVAAARTLAQQELLRKIQAEALKKDPNARPVPPAKLPEVSWADIKLQPSEEKARAQYKALIEDKAFADLPLAGEARLELAELLTQRQEYGSALKLLQEAIDKKWHAGMADRFRLQLGLVHLAKKDFRTALAQFNAVAKNPRSPQAGPAHYHAGECLMARKDYAQAAERWVVFRDQKAFQKLPGWTDRALLRLGHAYEKLKDWDRSRQAYELLADRFRDSPWAAQARYGIAFAWQNQKQYNKAVTWYARLAVSSTETAARAQFQIGLCRREQKRYGDAVAAFLLVPFSYDFPEWSAAGLCEAAQTLVADKKPRQAEKLLRRVIQDYPRSPWAGVARERLEKLTKR